MRASDQNDLQIRRRTKRQDLGDFGEELVRKTMRCPKCKRKNTYRRLPENFKCADIICDFCGFVAQVKTARRRDPEIIGSMYLGGAWSPQKARMDAGIYTTLYFVNVPQDDEPSAARCFIFFLPAEAQEPEMFVPREPLGPHARRAGWQGFKIELGGFTSRVIPVGPAGQIKDE